MTITEFLTARLDEDEAAARDLEGSAGLGHWDIQPRYQAGAGLIDARTGLLAEFSDRAVPAHIARHDPARVLREVEAVRKLLAAYQPNGQGVAYTLEAGLEFALKHRAAVYSDHPDYDPAWSGD